jgi:hypothetical protein
VEQAVLDEVKAQVGPEKYTEIDSLTAIINAVRKQNLFEQILA